MSQEVVQQIIGKAATDSEFRKLLLENPGEALKDHDLTDDEKDALKNMSQEGLDQFAGDLDERISKSTGFKWITSK